MSKADRKTPVSDDGAVDEFRSLGFVVLRSAFDPGPLAREVDEALDDGVGAPMTAGIAGNQFRYVPMMSERTPVSILLLAALAEPAARLLGCDVLPVRAKATRYFGGTRWHCDSELGVASIGLAAYLEPLEASTGALRVLPGSHRSLGRLVSLPDGGDGNGTAIATDPGDVIAFDEHLWHSSAGGVERRQWRIDFVADPTTPEEEARVRSYFAGIFRPGWDGGYDVDRYPSYGPRWHGSRSSWVDRLGELGACRLAEEEEAAVRSSRLG